MKLSKSVITRSTLAFALILSFALASPSGLLASSPKEGAMMTLAQNMERQSAMKERHNKMMTQMRDQDAALAEQITAIKSAPEDQKLELLLILVTDMVEQRTAMHESMAAMMDDMSKSPMTRPKMKGMASKSSKADSNEQE